MLAFNLIASVGALSTLWLLEHIRCETYKAIMESFDEQRPEHSGDIFPPSYEGYFISIYEYTYTHTE